MITLSIPLSVRGVCNFSRRDLLRPKICPAFGMNNNRTGIAIGHGVCRFPTTRGRNNLIGRCQTNSITISGGIDMNKTVWLYSTDTARDLWKLNVNNIYCSEGSALLSDVIAGGLVVKGLTSINKEETACAKSEPLPAHTPTRE